MQLDALTGDNVGVVELRTNVSGRLLSPQERFKSSFYPLHFIFLKRHWEYASSNGLTLNWTKWFRF